jgi:hypothetical protein
MLRRGGDRNCAPRGDTLDTSHPVPPVAQGNLQNIALLTATPRWPLARQTPGESLCWQDCRFIVNPPNGRFDGIIAYDAILGEVSLECPPDRVILVTGEPPSIKAYHERFAAQFSSVVTCHSDLAHPGLVLTQQGYPWIAGMNKNAADLGRGATTIDGFRALPAPSKTRLLSVVVSDKVVTAAHRQRRDFVAALRTHFGSDLEIFGRGVRDVADKSEALLPFRYHLALENSAFFHYWTEKLADPLLCWSFPLYWGCPNIEEYFPPGSFERINIYDTKQAIAAIDRVVAGDVYASALPALAEARRRILEDYHLFALAARQCTPSATAAVTVRLRPEQAFRDHWTRKIRHRAKRVLPRRWRKSKTAPLGAASE